MEKIENDIKNMLGRDVKYNGGCFAYCDAGSIWLLLIAV